MRIKQSIVLTIVIALVAFTVYYWRIGELQFVGREVAFIKAEIVDIKIDHVGDGNFRQYVTYQFEYKNDTYTGNFRAGSLTTKQEVGRYVKVKFSVSNPDKSLRLYTYKSAKGRKENSTIVVHGKARE